jgi:5'(3')-deoxyribonucleotidase
LIDKLIVYIDLDDTLCDYSSAFEQSKVDNPDCDFPQSVEGFFLGLAPLKDAVTTYQWLSACPKLDVYLLSAPSVHNTHCYTEKRIWVERHLGFEAVDRLIISSHKNLCRGDYLIDDYASGKGQEGFDGRLIHFGSEQFSNWQTVRAYFTELLDCKVQEAEEWFFTQKDYSLNEIRRNPWFDSIALLSFYDSGKFLHEKVAEGVLEFFVSIPSADMDRVAAEWCMHRQLDDSDLVRVVSERSKQLEIPINIDDL